MATLLRPSARQVSRLVSLPVRTASRSSPCRIAHTPRLLPATISGGRISRFYSTEPPKKPVNSNKPDERKSSSKKSAPQDQKNDGAPVEKEEGDSKEDSTVNASANAEPQSKEPLPPGWVYLDKSDMELLRELFKLSPAGGGKEEDLQHTLKSIAKYGAPAELKDLLAKRVENKGLTIGDAMRAIKIAYKLANRLAEAGVEPSPSARKDQNVNAENTFTDNQRMQQNQEQDPQPDGKPRQTGGQQQQQGGQGSQGQGQGQGQPEPGKTFDVSDFVTWFLAAAVLYPFYSIFFSSESSRETTWQEVRKNFLNKGLVEKLIISQHRVRVELDREATAAMYPDSVAANPNFHYYFSIGSPDAFEKRLEEAQDQLQIPTAERIPVSYVTEGAFGNLMMAFGPTLLFIGLLYMLNRRSFGGGGGGAGGVFGFGKSKAKRFNQDMTVKVKFSDVAGMDEAKLEIMEFVSFLKNPEKFQRLGAKIPRGAILGGPPGTGKTLLAKATAGESGVPFFSVSGSEFVEMFVGVGASRVRDLFATARKNAPCIIFIDEIDAIGKSRADGPGKYGGGNDEREATLNQILTEMDGFNTTEQVVVLAGTNRPDILDKALMRPGRFDRHINIDRPTMKGRQDIFRVHLAKIVTKEDMDYLTGRLAALTPGFSGADIANAVNEAALVAARANAQSVEMIHFEQAIERVIGGLERKSLVLNPEEKRTVAYHEAGHAICGWYFKYADPLLKVSIIPRGQGALGYAQYLPVGDAYLMNVNQLMDRMAMTLGGRISEELHFETVTTGASDDFRKVTAMATKMVTEWGMSDQLGPLHFQQDQNQIQKPFAESTAQKIDAEVRRIVDAAYKQCKDLLTAKKAEVGIVAEELLRKEFLTRDDMIRLLGPRPFPDKDEFTKFFDNTGGKIAPPPPPTEATKGEAPSPEPATFTDLSDR